MVSYNFCFILYSLKRDMGFGYYFGIYSFLLVFYFYYFTFYTFDARAYTFGGIIYTFGEGLLYLTF